MKIGKALSRTDCYLVPGFPVHKNTTAATKHIVVAGCNLFLLYKCEVHVGPSLQSQRWGFPRKELADKVCKKGYRTGWQENWIQWSSYATLWERLSDCSCLKPDIVSRTSPVNLFKLKYTVTVWKWFTNKPKTQDLHGNLIWKLIPTKPQSHKRLPFGYACQEVPQQQQLLWIEYLFRDWASKLVAWEIIKCIEFTTVPKCRRYIWSPLEKALQALQISHLPGYWTICHGIKLVSVSDKCICPRTTTFPNSAGIDQTRLQRKSMEQERQHRKRKQERDWIGNLHCNRTHRQQIVPQKHAIWAGIEPVSLIMPLKKGI